MWFCSYVIFLLRDEWMIERLSEAMGAALVGNNFSPILLEFYFTLKKKWLVAARNVQSIKTLFALELSHSRKSGSMFSSSELVAARSDCRRLGNALKRPSDQGKQSRSAAPRAWPLILPNQPSITFWSSLRRDCQMTGGAWTWTQTWTVPPDQRVVKVL